MTRLLSTRELRGLDRALARRTGDRVRVGRKPMTRAEGIALWNATTAFELPVSGSSLPFRNAIASGTLLAATASLGACATLGGNVKGDFACRAPDGICAPTTTIDDAALALIGGETGTVSPAGPYTPAIELSPRTTLASAVTVRSGEKVLRIVFPAHIDGAGRFREASAVHAVVERGAWMTAGSVSVAPARTSSLVAPVMPASSETSALASRSLIEFASAAPEVQFPDRVADIDAEVASADVTQVARTLPPASATAINHGAAVVAGGRVAYAGQPRAPAARGAGIAPVAASEPTRVVTPPAAIRYSLPPKASTSTSSNPLDAIKAQVSAQLRAPQPLSPAVGGNPERSANTGKSTAKAANAPSLFPVSEVNR